jgi:hypothetical protein
MGAKATAQSKRFAGGKAGCTGSWKAEKVGGAYLSEKLRGKAEREATGERRLQHAVAGGGDDGPKLRSTASDSEGKEPKLRPTQESSSGYAPNSSRKRRELRTIGVKALQDRPKSIEPVGNRRNT